LALSDNTTTLIELLRQREAKGIQKYGVTLDRTDLRPEEWMQHAIEELLDGAAYLQGLKRYWAQLEGENAMLTARLVAVAALPEKWRDRARNWAGPETENCAEELEDELVKERLNDSHS
jgi:hypothetical protein